MFLQDEFNALPHDEQLWFNRPLDKRRSVYANGREFGLMKDVEMTFIATINPITYGGVNSVSESVRSRYIGLVLPYPTTTELSKLINWRDVKQDVKDCILTVCQQINGLKAKGLVDYVFSPRDIEQFCDVIRTYPDWNISNVLENVVLIKYNDPQEREQVKIRINETFGVSL